MYAPLEGKMLRELGDDFDSQCVRKLGNLYRELHDNGIYLRSLHLGNVVLTPQGSLGLIDFADMRIYKKALPKRLRIRNFQHLSRYDEDRQSIATHFNALLDGLNDNSLKLELQRLFRSS